MEGRVSYRGLGPAGSPEGAGARALQAGLAARSPEGTAAKGMQIKGKEDLWVEIQANTFRNWVNEHVKPLDMKVTDLSTDLQSGTVLCALVEQLQGRALRPAPHRRPASTHHCLENVTAALNAIEADGVKLVNIGNVDIVNGNLKLILGLIWSLIVRYQIGRSKFPPRKLMLAWLQAVLPECRVGNLTTDWNSGVLLSALLDYCSPGLSSHWRSLNPNDSIENCRRAMEQAQREFGVPMVLEPEYLASPWLDELSGMTYLSYFMKPDSPGFHATLRWVNSRLQRPVTNFTSDWNDGRVSCEVIRGLGGSAPAPEKLRLEPQHWEQNHQQAIEAGRRLGVEPLLSARDMSSREVEHLGVMAYAAHFQWVKPRPPLADLLQLSLTSTSGRVGEPMNFRVDLLSKELDFSQIKAYVVTPAEQMHPVRLQDRGHGTFTPDKMGMHEIVLDVDDVRVDNRFFFRVLPRLVTVAPPGMAPCALGSLVEVLVNATGAPRREDIMVTAHSPSGRAVRCPLQTVDDTSSAIFQPDEPGTWEISITYQGKNIQGGPFTCDVFDPAGVTASGLEGAVAHKAHYFLLDTAGCGPLHRGEVAVDIVHDKRSIMCAVEKLDAHSYRVSFMPKDNGKHRIYVYYNGYDVKGSPFMMRVGSHKGKSPKTRDSPVRVSSPAGKYREGSPLNGSVLKTSRESNRLDESNLSHDFSKSKISRDSTRLDESNLSHDFSKSKISRDSTRLDESNLSHDFSKSKISRDSTRLDESNLSHDFSKSKISRDSARLDESNLSHDYSKSKVSRDSTRLDESNLSHEFGRSKISRDSTRIGESNLIHDFSKSKISLDSTRLDESNAYKSSFNDSYDLQKSSYDVTDSSYVTRVTKMQDINTTSKYRSESPRNITASPIGNRFLGEPRQDFHRGASPIARTASPIGRTASPIGRTASPIGRTASPINRTGSPVYSPRQVERSSPSGGYSYNTTIESHSGSGVDTSSNMRVSAGRGPARRDSWDAIAKTRHLMSANSLESLANLTEASLSTGLDRSRAEVSPGRQDAETLRNTQLNRSTHYSRFADTSRDTFNRHLDRLAGEEEDHYSKTVSESRSQLLTSSAQQSFLSNRPPQGGGATGLGGVSEADASHNRFRSQLTSVLEKGGAKAVVVKSIPDGVVGEPVEFEIDGSRAGSGNLEILVNGGRVTSAVRALGGQRFRASFTPHRPATHAIQITFNDETVPGSPWEVQVMSAGGGGGGAVVGEGTRLVPAREPAVFEVLAAPGGGSFTKGEIGVTVVAPSKRLVAPRVAEVATQPGSFRIEFLPEEVGTHIIEVAIGGNKLSAGPLVAKVYDSSLIQVSDVSSGVVGQPCQFRVDASAAGEGQLEISINEGEVPNHVQVVGGGRCLVSFTPEQARPHYIDIKFNGETVRGCPFLCNIADTGRVTLNLSNLELIPVGSPSSFQLSVRGGGGAAELAVAVRGPRGELPVRVAGDAHAGLSADFTPDAVGPHTVTVEYNGHPVQGTPFVAKAYDARLVSVGAVSGGGAGAAGAVVGGPAHFSVDASRAGEGNLEITISARGLNIPTQVHPQGNARFSVSFVPAEACDHIINVSFNKKAVPGCPMVVGVSGGGGPGPQVALPPPGPVLQPAHLLITHPGGKLEDIEVNVEGPNGGSVPASVLEAGAGLFRAEFVPRAVGEHRLHVLLRSQPCPGSPFTAKVYDVNAIRVKDVASGTVGKPVTFLVETSQAGPGNLEVTVNGGRVPTSAQAQGQHTYAISFTPREPQAHTVDLRFNGQDVPGSPFQCQISSPARVVDVDSLEKVSVGALCEFSVESPAAPSVEVLGPARRALAAAVSSSGPGLHSVSFTPLDVGDHSVEVRLPAGGHVEGSPFLLKAYSAERVTVTDISPGLVGRPVGFTINASQAGAGNLEIIVAVGGRNVPNYVQSEGNARFKVNFKPVEAAPHSLSVRFNGRPVPGSPFTCLVSGAPGAPATGASAGAPPASARVKGDALRTAQRGQQAEIQLAGFGGVEPQVTVTGPGGSTLPVRLAVGSAAGDWVARWAPEQVGRHTLAVQAAGAPLPGSPFTCNVYDVARVRVTGLGPGGLEGMVEGLSLGDAARGEAGRPLTFSVDAASAGEGTLELVVSTAHSTVKAEVVACARGLYDVTFVPQSCEMHFVNITFNEAAVPGSPFQCDIQETVNHVQIGGTATVDLPTAAHTLEIVDPEGEVVPHTVWAGLAEFGVGRVGRYVARATDPQSRPLYIKNINAFDSSKVRVLSVGDAYCHRPAIITVSVAEAGAGVLTATVRCGGAAVPHSVRSSASRQELVYHPSRAAPHSVTLLYNGVPVSRRPLKPNVLSAAVGQEVTASGLGLYQARVGQVSSFSIDTLGRPARELDVVVSGPGGTALPVRCYQTKSGMLQAEFTVTQVGQCTIEVLHLSKPVSGSPFTCQAFDPLKVQLVNVPHGNVSVHTPICFTLNTNGAGLAELEVSATGPQGQGLAVEASGPTQEGAEGTAEGEGGHNVQLLPNTPGHYRIYCSYGGVSVPGSPLSVGVVSGRSGGTAGSSQGSQGAATRASGAGLTIAHVGKEAVFTVISPHAQPNVQIEQVSGHEDAWSEGAGQLLECSVAGLGRGEWRCSYIPLYVGLYEVRLSCPHQGPLPGSPWDLKVIDTSAVSVVGGWALQLEAGGGGRLKVPAKLVFLTAGAGPGELQAMLGGRSAIVETVSDRSVVTLAPPDGTPAGAELPLELLYGGVAVAGAPRAAVAVGGGVAGATGATAGGASERVLLAGRGLATAHVGETAHFTIDGSQAGNGAPEVVLQSRSLGRAVGVALTRAGPALWKAAYAAPQPGHYLLRVLWDNRLVKGCPLSVVVSGGADASLVTCSGVGLSQGVVGREIRSWIDTRRAGPGELTAHCTGPRKVAYCELYEHGDATFTLNVKPQEAGRHQLTVKYAGEHVPGSPFQLRVAGAPDASKVRVYGPGVEAGVLATFQSRFICDTRGAGAGQLTVRVRGPKGAFRVEMQRESQKDRTILCKFDPTEPGDYRVEVKWAGKLVPGSPFPVMIFDTQEELRRYMHSGQDHHSTLKQDTIPNDHKFNSYVAREVSCWKYFWREFHRRVIRFLCSCS